MRAGTGVSGGGGDARAGPVGSRRIPSQATRRVGNDESFAHPTAQMTPRIWQSALGHVAAAVAAALLLVAVGQPLFTDDAWWHLALGRAFGEHGPWLSQDPLLIAPQSPPSASAWLFDLALHGAHALAGFAGLRALHAAAVAAVLGLVWSLLRRASGSALAASAGTVIFIALSTYRLAQLRPDLVTIAFSLGLYRALIDTERPPSLARIASCAALFALWANAHAAFPVGLLLLGAAAFAAGVSAIATGEESEKARARRLGAAWLAGLAATLCNPIGVRAYAAWFAAGTSTPSLTRVLDEWSPVNPLAWPQPTLPPTPVAWFLVWGLLVGTALLVPRAIASLRAGARADRIDPAAVGAAAISLALMLAASRFLWLGVFPLLLLARALRGTARGNWVLALAPALCTALFLRWGDWPLVTRALPRTLEGYAAPYAAGKYYPEAVWLARDAGLEGGLYCDYFQAGFAGYWLAPRIRTLTNGTLNVPTATLSAAAAIGIRRGVEPGETFAALLDRSGIDLFLGIRLPETGNPYRPWVSTTAHLEDTPGWIPVFRNLGAALYLRSNERNRENLARIAQYYASQYVPFDPARGFEPLAAIRAAPDWARDHGLMPEGFGALDHVARTGAGESAALARDRIAAIYASLGAYAEASALDREILRERPQAVRARRRLAWNLLHLERYAEAQEAAAGLADRPKDDALSHAIARAAHNLGAFEPDEARARLALLPAFERSEVPWLLAGVPPAQARTR